MNANSRDEDGDDIRPCLKYRLHFKFAKKKLCKPAQPERLHLYHSYIVILKEDKCNEASWLRNLKFYRGKLLFVYMVLTL